MLVISLIQIAETVGATYIAARTAGLVGRDLRAALFRRAADRLGHGNGGKGAITCSRLAHHSSGYHGAVVAVTELQTT